MSSPLQKNITLIKGELQSRSVVRLFEILRESPSPQLLEAVREQKLLWQIDWCNETLLLACHHARSAAAAVLEPAQQNDYRNYLEFLPLAMSIVR